MYQHPLSILTRGRPRSASADGTPGTAIQGRHSCALWGAEGSSHECRHLLLVKAEMAWTMVREYHGGLQCLRLQNSVAGDHVKDSWHLHCYWQTG